MKKDESLGALINLKTFVGKPDEAIALLQNRFSLSRKVVLHLVVDKPGWMHILYGVWIVSERNNIGKHWLISKQLLIFLRICARNNEDFV